MEIRAHTLHLSRLREQTLDTDEVWTGAIRRYLSKANSLTFRVGELTRKAEVTNSDVRLDSLNALLHPLGTINSSGVITWNSDMAPHAHPVDPRRIPPPQ